MSFFYKKFLNCHVALFSFFLDLMCEREREIKFPKTCQSSRETGPFSGFYERMCVCVCGFLCVCVWVLGCCSEPSTVWLITSYLVL